MPRLYEVTAKLRELDRLIEDMDGDLPDDLASLLGAVEAERDEQFAGVIAMIKNLAADVTEYRSEAARLQEIARRKEYRQERLKELLLREMQAQGLAKFSHGVHKATVCANSKPSVVLVDGAEVPPQFQRVKIELDKGKVLEFWAREGFVPSDVLLTQGNHVRVG